MLTYKTMKKEDVGNVINLHKMEETRLPDESSRKTHRKDLVKEMRLLEKEDEVSFEEKIEIPVTEGINQLGPDDFGYLTIYHTGSLDDEMRIKNMKKIDEKGKLHENTFYTSGNFMRIYNQKKNSERKYKSSLQLFVELVKEEKLSLNDINIDNPYLIQERKNHRSTKKATKSQSAKDEEENDDDLIKNTENSRIRALQIKNLIDDDIQEARNINFEYTMRKVKYEVELIKLQLKKFDHFISRDKAVHITSEKPFYELKTNTIKFLKSYEEFIEESNLKLPSTRVRVLQYSLEARSFLFSFMNGIIRHYDKDMKEKRIAGEKTKSYISWKTKMSQLVGIWDLANSNGTEIRVSSKYLMLKRFLTLRAAGRQINRDYISLSEEEKYLVRNGCCTNDRNTIIHPLGIMKETDTLRKVMEIIVVFFLLYSFLTVPFRLLMKIESNTMKLIEKFVDMYFYIDIMIAFRTAYKDKFNEDRFDVSDIANRYFSTFFYVDFISTVPWYYFFLSTKFNETVRIFTHILKIFRVTKLLPILNKLEELKAANYFRIMKLMLIYFLVTHWLACIIFFGIDVALLYGILNRSCYTSTSQFNKYTLNQECTYIISYYNSAYSIPGQYTTYQNAFTSLAVYSEYLILLIQFLVGQFLSAYVFGGMTSIIQNLDQGSNFFIEKTDLLREHMLFYNVGKDVQNNVRVYYDYLWQRHKDVIYGKHHFDLLSKSLRERFENYNLVGNEIYLHTFHKLNNHKLIGHILRELNKIILFPYEILYEEGDLVKGLYLLTNGDLEFNSYKNENAGHSSHSVEYSKVLQELYLHNEKKNSNFDDVAEELCVIFPMVSMFIKTGRTYQRCEAIDFTDVLFLPMKSFDDIIMSFPVEMHSLKHDIIKYVEKTKLFENMELFKTLAEHSSRSIGKNYEKEYTALSIWITIPIPISQRKIATNYIESFVKKIKNQWREILLPCDMNICLNSNMITNFIKNETHHNKDQKEEQNEKNAIIQQGDQLDVLKNLSRTMATISHEFSEIISSENFRYKR
jgi:hypothetical protein